MSPESGTLDLSVTIGGASFSASGETAVVLDAYADFKKLISAAPVVQPEEDSVEEPTPPKPATPAKVKSPTSLPLKPYLAGLTLRGNKEKATAIVAWSAESGGKAALTVTEVEKLWRKTPFRAPSNLPRDLRGAEGEGWLDPQGKSGSPEATYSINGYGEGIMAGWATPSKD